MRTMADITVYGADWCEDTQRTREHLEARQVIYDYVNVDRDDAAKRQVEEWNDGRCKTPTVVLDDDPSTRLVEPTNEEMDAALERRRAG
jgi:glutaredoxin